MPIRSKIVPHAEIQMLGVPLGSDHFVSDFVSKKLLGRLSATVDKLVDFEDSQAATYLLRVSYSIVRAVHFMRTVPLSKWIEQATTFDSMVRKAIEDILGCPMNDLTFAQASLTPKLGGLGLRKTVHGLLRELARVTAHRPRDLDPPRRSARAVPLP